MLFFRSKDQIFEPPSRLERILAAPLKYLISLAYRIFVYLRSAPKPKSHHIRVVCISDTHTLKLHHIPDGDLLIHAGDLTNAGTTVELQDAIDWLTSFPHTHKVAIAGNHDTFLDPRSRMTLATEDQSGALDWKGIHYLQHSSIKLSFPTHQNGTRTISIYGAPQIPHCGGSNFAFQYTRGQDAWTDTIPTQTDILVTHTPPKYHLDLVNPSLGCEHLLAETWRRKPRLHVFGHVHVGAGRTMALWDETQRAYEAGMARPSKGLIQQSLDVLAWTALAKTIVHGVIGLLWDRIWGGENKSTIMVNAALMKANTGVLGNQIQVVDM